MVLLVFQSVGARANPPSGANEFNHAYYGNGGYATASGSSGSNTPNKGIDGNENSTVTYWQSSTTTGWLAVRFTPRAYVDIVHIHFDANSKIYPSLSLYYDLNGNGAYETNERVWSTTSNPSRDVVAPTGTSYAFSMKLAIDAKVGSNKPMIDEFEAYLESDTDGDGLTNDLETRTVYFYQSAATGLPGTMPDVGSNSTTLTMNRLAGVPFRGLADFTVVHGNKNALSAVLSYWDGSAWVDFPIWDPGKYLTLPTFLSPTGSGYRNGVVAVQASVNQTTLVTSVEFFVDGVSKNVATIPCGNVYSWNWDTSAYSTGSHVLVVRSHDIWGGSSDAQQTVYVDGSAPTVSITSDPSLICPPETVTITASASDAGGLDYVVYEDSTTYLYGATSWYNSQSYELGGAATFTISATDLAGHTASSSVSVRVPHQCVPDECDPLDPICIQSPIQAGPQALTAAPRTGEGFFIDPTAATITGGTGKSTLEAGYSVVGGTTHRVLVNLTNPLSTLTTAERSARIAAPGLSPDVLNRAQTWRLTITDWLPSFQASITSWSLRIEEKTNPLIADTDSDTLSDGVEALVKGSSPIAQDTDVDGLTDDYELTGHSLTVWANGVSSILTGVTTNATRWDTDADGLADGQERGFVTTGQSKVIGEVGRVTGVTTTCTGRDVVRVFLRNRYTSPIVIAEPPTRADTAKGVIRVTGMTDHTFDVCFQEWQGDTMHTPESVDYLVLEVGDHVLADGARVEAGSASVGTTYASVTFREPFAGAPVVLAQTQGLANTGTTEARIKDVGGSSFSVHLRTPSGSGVTETIGYVAVSPQADPSSLATWTRGAVSAGTGTTGQIPFPAGFTSAPRFLAWFASENGNIDVGLRLSSLTNVSASYVRDTTGTAVAEDLAYIAFGQSMNLTARMTTRPNGTGSADTDGDGINDGLEANAYGSSPVLKDTDADGIPDNVEAAPRTMMVPINGVLQPITFTTSPTSDDTDGDGVKDPDELNGILDHRLLFYNMSATVDSAHLRDLSGNGCSGALFGPTNATGSNAIKVGAAMDFDGVNDNVYATIPGMSALSAWSFSLWVKWDNGASGSSYQHPIGFGIGHDVTVYFAKTTYNLVIKATDGAGATVVEAGVAYSSTTAVQPHHVGVTFDGTYLRAYIDDVAMGPWPASPLRIRSDVVRIGSSAILGLNYFDGRIDEVQVWDRTLTAPEMTSYYNLTNAGGIVTRLDMETRTPAGDLADFGGNGRSGATTGTTVVEGRSGFALKFAGGTDGVSLAGSASVAITSGVTVDVYVLLTSAPSKDVSLIARKASFYLNVSSDDAVRWTLYTKGSIASPLPIPLNRWVRITATATTSSMSLYLDGNLVTAGTAQAFPSSLNLITLGYTEGKDHLTGAIDEVFVSSNAASAGTVAGLGVRGIVLNPSATDTDGDGLADGQELFTKTVKSAKRYPIPDYGSVAYTEALVLGGVPGWAVSRADAMVGITHPDMYGIKTDMILQKGTMSEKTIHLRPRYVGTGVNNFTSFDLLQIAVSRSDLALSTTYTLGADDAFYPNVGQIEYFQLQLTAHTLPNRADTDRDGLNDSEEVNLANDGFQTSPWLGDTDADSVPDGLEVGGWTWSGSVIISSPTGFRTDPTRADTDRDGVLDGNDRAPLGDAFVRVMFEWATIYGGSDDDTTSSRFEPFASIRVGDQTAYTKNTSVTSGSRAYMVFAYVANVPDDQTYVPVTIEIWDYDAVQSNGYPDDTHERFAVNGSLLTWTVNHPLAWVGTKDYSASGTGSFRAEGIAMTVETVYPNRISAYLAIPWDYTGIYNVTNSGGSTVSRRYVGEPRLVSIVLNVTKVIPHTTLHYQVVYFVPRAVFFDSMLYQRLATRNTAWPLTNLAFRQNSTTAGPNSDDLQQVLSGNVSGDEETGILRLLYLNTTSATRYRIVDVDLNASQDTLFMYTLPDNALRLIGYTPFTVDSSVQYRFCSTPNCGQNPVPKPIWEQIWDGIVATVTAWIVSAVVLAVTAFAKLVEILAQVGNWLAQAVSTAAQAVASAVQAAAKAFDGFANWIIDGALSLLRSSLPTFESGALVSALGLPPIPADGSQMTPEGVGAFVNAVFSGWFFSVLIAIGLVVETVATWLSLQSFGAAMIVKGILGPRVVDAIINVLLKKMVTGLTISLALLSGIEAVLYLVLPQTDSFWREGLGMSLFAFAISAYKLVQAKLAGSLDPTKVHLELVGFAITVVGLVMAFGTSSVLGAWIGLVLSGIGLLITWTNTDLFDLSPVSPLNAVEEITGVAAVGYAAATLAKEYAT